MKPIVCLIWVSNLKFARSLIKFDQIDKLLCGVPPGPRKSSVSLSIDNRYTALPADTAGGIFTSGLLGENYIGLSPGGDPEVLKPGEEIAFTQPAVDLLQLAGKYMFSGGANNAGAGSGETPASGETAPPVTEEPTP